MKYLKVLFILFLTLFLITNVSCGDKPIDEKKNPIEKEETYYEITFLDGEDVITVLKIKEGEKITYPQAPTHDGFNFTGWSVNLEYASYDVTIEAQYETIQTRYEITYVVDDEDWICKNKEEVVENFLNDFYDFVSPKESKVAFLYGLNGGNPSWYNYLGGSVGSLNYLLKDNNLDLDDDEEK